MYKCLENEVMPTFNQCNPRGIPESWVNRVRHCMAELKTAEKNRPCSSKPLRTDLPEQTKRGIALP